MLKIALEKGGFFPSIHPQIKAEAKENSSTQEFVIKKKNALFNVCQPLIHRKIAIKRKQKRHTCKNNIIVLALSGKIGHDSVTIDGKKSDNRNADEDNCSFPTNTGKFHINVEYFQ
jgi:hypothetical protein